MKNIFFFSILIISGITAKAQEFMPLWPEGKKPNSNGKPVKDSLADERIWKVATPGIYAFPVPAAENKGTAVLICPGGGYTRLSHIYNGFQMAKWYNTHGINAFVLIYRLPHQADLVQRAAAPLQDAQRAMKIIRAQAAQWKIKPDKIGVMGVSAGGHLASMLGTMPGDISRIGDKLDTVAARPDFMILQSPVISMGKYAHAGSKRNLLGTDTTKAMIDKYSTEKQVSAFTPPTFMVHAQNDSSVKLQNSLLFYNALIDNNISASLHVFPQGGHGIKLSDNPGSTTLWLPLLELWMQEQGLTEPVKK